MTIYDNLNVGGFRRSPSLFACWRRVGSCVYLLFGLWMGLFAMLHSTAHAKPLPAQNQASSINLEPYAALLIDPSGLMTADEVASPKNAGLFSPLVKPLGLGFTRSVAWVKIDLVSAESSKWLLEVGQPILEDVRLYERLPSGELLERFGTHSQAQDQREVNYRRPVFNVDLTANEPVAVYLRLATRTSLTTNLKLWSPMALFEHSNQETFAWGLVFGSYLLVLFFYSAFWLWTREKVHLYYVLYVGVNLGAAFFTGHFGDMLGINFSAYTHSMVLGVFICLSLWVGPVFSVSFLGVERIWPKSTRFFLQTCTSVSVLCIALVVMGFYGQGVMAVQIASMFVIVFNTSVSGYLSYKGDKKAQLLLLAFSLFYIGVIWRYLRNIGLIEPTAWNESVYQVGAFVHMMVMSTGIFSSYNALRTSGEKEQARALAQERQRERQYEFLGMVSHEVRTPLTVISASADNLLMDASLSGEAKNRVEKIIRHGEKLQNLFDTYLDNERLLNGDNPLKNSRVDLCQLCELLTQDFEDAHGVRIALERPHQLIAFCDADLLRVAVSNLLENARKHAQSKSGIALELNLSDGQVRIAVSDQGPGVDDLDLPFIFDAYYRGQGAYKSVGAGLGLHLVRFIAQQHQGQVTAQKLQPQGMRFVITIPVGQARSGV